MPLKDFIDDHSVLTPSVAGGLVLAFSLPLAEMLEIGFKPVALATSFLISGLIVFAVAEQMRHSQRALCLLLNAFIIFSISIGIGMSGNPPKAPPNDPEMVKLITKILNEHGDESSQSPSSGFLLDLFGISSANAQTTTSENLKLNSVEVEKLKKYLERQSLYQEELKDYNRRWSWKVK
jgi:hypothetical protein